MDTTALRAAYEELAAEVEAGGFAPPPAGGWTAAQVVAHVVTNDALLAAATRAVLAGEPHTYHNHDVVDSAQLDAFLAGAPGDFPALAERVRESGAALCALADALDAEQERTLVPMLIRDGDEVRLDRPVPWGAALGVQAGAHLPNHLAQLRALRA
jgi:hypothetical protein